MYELKHYLDPVMSKITLIWRPNDYFTLSGKDVFVECQTKIYFILFVCPFRNIHIGRGSISPYCSGRGTNEG